jgi:hypothetical protein
MSTECSKVFLRLRFLDCLAFDIFEQGVAEEAEWRFFCELNRQVRKERQEKLEGNRIPWRTWRFN